MYTFTRNCHLSFSARPHSTKFQLVLGVLGLGLVSAIVSCGGGAASAPPASTPASADSTVVSVAAPPGASASPAAAPIASAPAELSALPSDAKAQTESATAHPSGSAAAAEPPSSGAHSQSPTDILTAPTVAFLIDYANSEAKPKALAACEKEAKKDDPEAKGACLQKARIQFKPDVLVFQKDKKGHVTLTIYKRTESDLKEVYFASIAFADETPNSVRLKFTGGERGQRPLFKSGKPPILSVPSNYSVEIDEPEFGKLRYDAKIGFINK